MLNSFLRCALPWFFKPQETKRPPVYIITDEGIVVSYGERGKPNGEGGRGGVAIGSGGMGTVNIATRDEIGWIARKGYTRLQPLSELTQPPEDAAK